MPKPRGYLLQPEVRRLNDALHALSQICIQKGDNKLALDCLKETKGVASMVAELRKAEIIGPGVSAMPQLPGQAIKQIEQAIAARKGALHNPSRTSDPLTNLGGGKNGGDAGTLGSTQYPRTAGRS